ncbi:MAG: FAD/NAD(P)-binding protein [Agrobacterium sp.]|nr:FAD/NAD(P)-binding protein [Agrobacterium sp.]
MSYDVAIVGSGFSAICTAAHLLFSAAGGSIALVGDESDFGRGTAYRTELPYHRLNVPAGRMSVFPNRPDDFLDWLTENGLGNDPLAFASRGDYGLYLRDRLATLLRKPSGSAGEGGFHPGPRLRPAGLMQGSGGFSFALENGEKAERTEQLSCALRCRRGKFARCKL